MYHEASSLFKLLGPLDPVGAYTAERVAAVWCRKPMLCYCNSNALKHSAKASNNDNLPEHQLAALCSVT